MIDRTRPLVPMASYSPPNDLNGNNFYYYPSEYRVLNCWECFEAEGKICTDFGHNSLYHHTKSSDPGNAFCCKPDSKDGYCQDGAKHDYDGVEEGIVSVCSEPSNGAPNSKFQSILTNGKNHQMFAYCPSINHQKCGITSSSGISTDFRLLAGLNEAQVYSNEIRYKKASPGDPTREYDSCYYEVVLDQSVIETHNPKQIKVQITKKTNMNVFIYGGTSRKEATQSVIAGNQQASEGSTYTIGADKGFLIVAYPNEVVSVQSGQTDFGFNYWLDAVEKSEDDDSAAVPVILNDSGSGKIVIEKNNNGADEPQK